MTCRSVRPESQRQGEPSALLKMRLTSPLVTDTAL
jgi:hypothetical protein